MLVLVVTLVYAAPMTVGTISTLGGGTDTVAHRQVLDYDVSAQKLKLRPSVKRWGVLYLETCTARLF